MSTREVLLARHRIAAAHNDVVAVAGGIARALAWQRGQEISVVNELETSLTNLSAAQRKLHEAIVDLRRAVTAEASTGGDNG